MATSTRLRGNVLPIFKIKLGADPAEDYADDTKSIGLAHSTKGDLTFAEAAAGLAFDSSLKVKLIAGFASTALFAFMMDNRGKDVVVTWGPQGNVVPSETQPHYQLACRVPAPPLDTEAAIDAKKSAESDVTFEGTADLVVIKV